MHGPVVNRGSITKGASSGTIRTDSVGVYNLGTWSYITLQLYSGAADDRHTLAVLANNPFSNANSTTNGYLELVGCAALPGTTTFQATNLLINDPSKITVSVPSGTPVIAGSGALEITGGSTGLSFGITPDAQLGQLKYLVYTSTGPQSVNISDNGGMTVGELRLTGGTKLFENSRTVTGQLVISPFTALENGSGGSPTLTVVGSVRSYGTVANYDGSKHLTVQVSGDLQNSGIWNAYVTELTGSAARRVNGGFPLGGTTKIPAPFELAGSARFGALTLGAGGAYASLTFPASLPLPRIEATGTLSGQGGVHRGKLLINNAGDQQIQANLVADRIEISGSGLKRVYRQTFIGDLIVQPGATLTTWPDVWSELYVDGSLTNYGTIRNRTDYSANYRDLYLYVAKNSFNRYQAGASWTNTRTKVYWPAVPNATTYQFDISPDEQNWTSNTQSGTTKEITTLLTTAHPRAQLTPSSNRCPQVPRCAQSAEPAPRNLQRLSTYRSSIRLRRKPTPSPTTTTTRIADLTLDPPCSPLNRSG